MNRALNNWVAAALANQRAAGEFATEFYRLWFGGWPLSNPVDGEKPCDSE